MKKLIALIVLGALAPALSAAVTLVSDSGPYGAVSYASNWVSLTGFNLGARSPGTNTVDFDVTIIQHGNPLGSNFYDMKITVVDLTTGTGYDIEYTDGTAGSKSVPVFVPSGHQYNITLWAQSAQPFNATNYWELEISNILITAPF